MTIEANPALAKAALRSRVRSIIGDRFDPDEAREDDNVAGLATGDGEAFYQTSDQRGLGPALRWALATSSVARLHLIAESEVAGDLARRAEQFQLGPVDLEIAVWSATGPEVEKASATPVLPAPTLPESHLGFAEVIVAAGADPVDDHGMLVAEVAGLEVARVVEPWALDRSPDLDAAATEAGLAIPEAELIDPQLAIGVGQADRELQEYVHGHLDDLANLRRAVEAVRQHRTAGGQGHPLSRLARQRWLRSSVIHDPSLVGLDRIEAVPPLRPRQNIAGAEPCAALGHGSDGTALVVFSVGVDLDLLPEAVDYRLRDDPGAELIVVTPERDQRLAVGVLGACVPNLRLATVASPWA